jgi:hypothetical protein
MNIHALEKDLVSRIKLCDEFFTSIQLDKTYKLHYYTVFTKSEFEKKQFVELLNSKFKLIDSSNGIMFKADGNSFLSKHVRFIRVRNPDDSSTLIAGDVIKEDIDIVGKYLVRNNIDYSIIKRLENTIIEIESFNKQVAIYFPESHFLNKYY